MVYSFTSFAVVDVVYVTSFIGGYYPEFEFFYWVVELVLLIHLIFLIKRKTYTWEKLFFIDSIERDFPALCGIKTDSSILYGSVLDIIAACSDFSCSAVNATWV